MGPLAAGYFFAENYRALGQPDKVATAWTVAIVTTIVVFGGVMLLPFEVNIPSHLIPIAYTAVAYGLYHKYQKDEVTHHLAEGGQRQSWWLVVGIGFLSIIISIGAVFGVALLIE